MRHHLSGADRVEFKSDDTNRVGRCGLSLKSRLAVNCRISTTIQVGTARKWKRRR